MGPVFILSSRQASWRAFVQEFSCWVAAGTSILSGCTEMMDTRRAAFSRMDLPREELEGTSSRRLKLFFFPSVSSFDVSFLLLLWVRGSGPDLVEMWERGRCQFSIAGSRPGVLLSAYTSANTGCECCLFADQGRAQTKHRCVSGQ